MAFASFLSRGAAVLSMCVFAEAISCPNRHYCDTKEVKYRAFSALNDAYLHSTGHVIRNLPIKNRLDCKRECVRTSGCQSSNYFQKINSNVMMCEIMAGNRWSNASRLIRKMNSTHFFIQSPCASNPCKNGATCTSLDQEAKFQCDCRNGNHTVRFEGKYCETVRVAEEAAKVFFNFDQGNPVDVRSTYNMKMTSQSTMYTLRVPERNSPVLYLPGTTTTTMSAKYRNQCLTKTDNCLPGNGIEQDYDGLSVSFWFRILKRSLSVNNACKTRYNDVVKTSTNVSSHFGFVVSMNSCAHDAIKVSIRDTSRLHSLSCGSTCGSAMRQGWSHFMFTFSRSKGIVMFINGVQVAVKRAPDEVFDADAAHSHYLKFGYSSGGLEMYIDDFAAWYYYLLPEEINMVYNEGLKRNQNNWDRA